MRKALIALIIAGCLAASGCHGGESDVIGKWSVVMTLPKALTDAYDRLGGGMKADQTLGTVELRRDHTMVRSGFKDAFTHEPQPVETGTWKMSGKKVTMGGTGKGAKVLELTLSDDGKTMIPIIAKDPLMMGATMKFVRQGS